MANALLMFDYARVGFDDELDWVAVQVSGDGGASWTEVDRMAGPADDTEVRQALYDVSSYTSDDTMVRFVSSADLDAAGLASMRPAMELDPGSWYPPRSASSGLPGGQPRRARGGRVN